MARRSAFTNWDGVTNPVIACGSDAAAVDALTASGLAGALDCPLLLALSDGGSCRLTRPDYPSRLRGISDYVSRLFGGGLVRLSARSEYGMLALIDLAVAWGDSPLSVREIAERRKIPAAFLEQLLAAMRRAGLVTGVRGVRGGFVLSRDPATITALEVVEALEGPLAPTVCTLTDDCGRTSACAAASVWGDVATSVRDVLARWDLATLAKSQTSLESHLAQVKE